MIFPMKHWGLGSKKVFKENYGSVRVSHIQKRMTHIDPPSLDTSSPSAIEVLKRCGKSYQELDDVKDAIKKTSFFLTYSCNATKLNVNIIKDFLVDSRLAHKVIVVEEKTKAGKAHFHAVVFKENRFTVRNINFFDIQGEHPNIRVIGKEGITKPIGYCLKCLDDGIPVVTHNVDTHAYKYEREITVPKLNAIAKETNGDFEESCSVLSQQQVKVREWAPAVAYLKSICRESNRYFFEKFKYSKDDFVYDNPIEDYFSRYVNTDTKYDRYPVLVVTGLTRRGKTSAIRALGPHLYFKGDVDMTSFANVPDKCKFIVLDDISNANLEEYLHNNAFMLGMEDGWTQKFLYVGKKPVENKCPVVVLQNTPHRCFTDPTLETFVTKGYYYSNSIVVEINQHMAKHLRQLEEVIVSKLKPKLRYFDKDDEFPENSHDNRITIDKFFEKQIGDKLCRESPELEMRLRGFHSLAQELPKGIFGKNKTHHEIFMMLSSRQKHTDEELSRLNWPETELAARLADRPL